MSIRDAVDNLTALTLRRSSSTRVWPRLDVIEPNTAKRAWYDVDLKRDDVALDRWGKFYCANILHARGVLFETFMLDPPAIAQAVMFRKPMPLMPGQEFYPLLPEQRDAAAAEDDDLPVFLRKQAD